MLKWWNANQKKIEAHDAIIDDRDRLLQEVNTLRADKRVLQQKLDDMNEELNGAKKRAKSKRVEEQ